jgi:NADPH-dependent 2,4-dienoyl-CoA reductase/sulfur reductase-like enzyme
MNAGAPASVAVIGGGPAGLMAAEVLAAAGLSVDLYDAMPSVGRKFLLAGRGGLNLTHSRAAASCCAPAMAPAAAALRPGARRLWRRRICATGRGPGRGHLRRQQRTAFFQST